MMLKDLFCLMISSKDISTFSIFAAILFRYWWPRACSSDAMKKIMGLQCCLVCMILCGRSGDIYVRLGLLFRAHYVFFLFASFFVWTFRHGCKSFFSFLLKGDIKSARGISELAPVFVFRVYLSLVWVHILIPRANLRHKCSHANSNLNDFDLKVFFWNVFSN